MRDNSWGTPPTSRSIHTVFSFMSHSYRWRIILKYHIRGIPFQKRWFYPFPSIINSYFMSGIPNAIMIHKDLCCGYCPVPPATPFGDCPGSLQPGRHTKTYHTNAASPAPAASRVFLPGEC